MEEPVPRRSILMWAVPRFLRAWQSASPLHPQNSGTRVRRGNQVLHTAHPVLVVTNYNIFLADVLHFPKSPTPLPARTSRCRAIGLSCLPSVVSHGSQEAISHDLLPKSLGRPLAALIRVNATPRFPKKLGTRDICGSCYTRASFLLSALLAAAILTLALIRCTKDSLLATLRVSTSTSKVSMRLSRRLAASKTVSAASVAIRVLLTGSGRRRNQPLLHVPYLRRWMSLTSAKCPGGSSKLALPMSRTPPTLPAVFLPRAATNPPNNMLMHVPTTVNERHASTCGKTAANSKMMESAERGTERERSS